MKHVSGSGMVDEEQLKADLMSVLEDGSREVLAGGYTLMVGTEQVRFEIL